MRTLVSWNGFEHASPFPYESVISCLRVHGKHFASTDLLQALASLRDRFAPAAARGSDRLMLDRFLAVALDKWDHRYDYRTYLGIDLLTLESDARTADTEARSRYRNEWVGLLLADLWLFEEGAREGGHAWLPQMRPGSELLAKRIRLIESALMPVVKRLGGTEVATESPEGAGDIARRLFFDPPQERRLALMASMQPVYTVHDEYMFIRILQAFELTFSVMVAELRAAIENVQQKDPAEASRCVLRCSALLAEARILFSLLATMRAESFRAFRIYTEGASAIQSENYKIFEALCSPPHPERLDSPAFDAVGQLRDRIRRDWTDITSVVRQATVSGLLDSDGLALMNAATRELEAVHQRWKQTHWKLAARMIGEERGTGYTVGVPYLKGVIDNRLFPGPLGSEPMDHD